MGVLAEEGLLGGEHRAGPGGGESRQGVGLGEGGSEGGPRVRPGEATVHQVGPMDVAAMQDVFEDGCVQQEQGGFVEDSKRRGGGYRDHKDELRPPLGRHSAKGEMTVAADRLVQLWMQVALLWEVHGVQWAMKNPEGNTSLARRPYMRSAVREQVVMQVRVDSLDYCAYIMAGRT